MIYKKLRLLIYVNPLVNIEHTLFTLNYRNFSLKYFFPLIGWVQIPVKDIRDKPIRTFMIQIAVISNHQNGRDTHMRQIRVHSPMHGRKYPLEDVGRFTTIEFQQYSTIR